MTGRYLRRSTPAIDPVYGALDYVSKDENSYRIAACYDSILGHFGTGDIQPAYLPRVLMKMRVCGESNLSLDRSLR